MKGLEAGKLSPSDRGLNEEAISSLIKHLKEEHELIAEGLDYFIGEGKPRATYGDFLEKMDLIVQRLQSRKKTG